MAYRDGTVQKLDPSLIIEAAMAKTREVACPACTAKEWFVENPGADDTEIVGLWTRRGEGNYSLDNHVSDYVAIVCGNCGFTRLHRIEILLRGVDKQ